MRSSCAFLTRHGYVRSGTVREPGDFALRGGIVDLWPPGTDEPYRLDFFGSTLDAVRRFDAETQLSIDQISDIELLPASEVPLDKDTISRFRSGYVAQFGPASDDPLYEAISEGRHASRHASLAAAILRPSRNTVRLRRPSRW